MINPYAPRYAPRGIGKFIAKVGLGLKKPTTESGAHPHGSGRRGRGRSGRAAGKGASSRK